MAALRGTIRGDRQRGNSDAVSHRLADRRLSVRADTWQTFARIEMAKDGSGQVTLKRNGQTILRATWNAETAETPNVLVERLNSVELAR